METEPSSKAAGTQVTEPKASPVPTQRLVSDQYVRSTTSVTATNNHSIPKVSVPIIEQSPLVLYNRLVYEKVWLNFIVCDGCIGDTVKVKFELTDTGSIEHYEILQSSGNKKLEQAAIVAILKAEPFYMPNFSAEQLRKAKQVVINFTPK